MRLIFLPIAAALALAAPAFSAPVPPAPPGPASAALGDVVGSRDHPALPRFQGAEIRAWRNLPVADVWIPRGRIDDAAATDNVALLQGQATHIDYVVRPPVPPLDLDRYYEGVLRAAGYETVFSCTGVARCGTAMGELVLLSDHVAPAGFADGLFNDRLRVVTARKGATWIVLHIIEGPDRSLVYQLVLEGARDVA